MFAGWAGGPPFREGKNEGCAGMPSRASCTEGGPWESIAKSSWLSTSPRRSTQSRSRKGGGRDQAMRGASFLVAVTFAAEIGAGRRFDTPRQLMSFLGLVPAERSTGDTIRRNGLTLAGNRRARRALIEAAWTYRYPARVCETLRARLEALPKPVRDIAWKAQIRLCARYRRLSATGKKLMSSWRRSLARSLLSYGPSAGGRSSVSQDVPFFFPLRRAGSGARKV